MRSRRPLKDIAVANAAMLARMSGNIGPGVSASSTHAPENANKTSSGITHPFGGLVHALPASAPPLPASPFPFPPLPLPFPFPLLSSGMRSTETTFSSSSVRKMRTP